MHAALADDDEKQDDATSGRQGIADVGAAATAAAMLAGVYVERLKARAEFVVLEREKAALAAMEKRTRAMTATAKTRTPVGSWSGGGASGQGGVRSGMKASEKHVMQGVGPQLTGRFISKKEKSMFPRCQKGEPADVRPSVIYARLQALYAMARQLDRAIGPAHPVCL